MYDLLLSQAPVSTRQGTNTGDQVKNRQGDRLFIPPLHHTSMPITSVPTAGLGVTQGHSLMKRPFWLLFSALLRQDEERTEWLELDAICIFI